MGIKDLWTILSPFCERKPLYELQDKKVAIDLSCWICEAQNVAEYNVQPRMYLRNLYFRTCCLLLMGVTPVFVLEGKAPELKYDTIAARSAVQFKGTRPKKDGVQTGKDRTKFHHTLKQCQEMLKFMGLVCVQGKGEAEALCAYLNQDDLVDGIISQDSDCFAYGAKIVYRNFSISQQGAYAAKGGSVDVYDIAKANASLNFGRNKIIALALLCGSDYSEGVHGIGKDSALKLFETVSDRGILDRLRSWRKDRSLYANLEMRISDKNLCASCGHPGRVQAHAKSGCRDCKTTKGCDFTKFRDERLGIKNEINMRKKALTDPDFPNEELIKEFLTRKDDVKELRLNWNQPSLVNFVQFTVKYLTWEEVYAFEKFLPILTRWQLLNYEYIENNRLDGVLFPERIKKARVSKGTPCYEIVWTDRTDYYKGLVPEHQIEHDDKEKFWSTIEPQDLVEKAYPQLVLEFQESKKPKSKRKQKKAVDKISDLMQNISISEPKVKKTRKKPAKKDVQLKTLDSFVAKATSHCSTPVQVAKNCSFDLNMSEFGDENDSDLSGIVDNIVKRKLPSYVRENLEKYHLKVEENKVEDYKSSFFITRPTENDLFEKTFNELSKWDESSEECEDEGNGDRGCDDDSFLEDYVPLLERLKTK